MAHTSYIAKWKTLQFKTFTFTTSTFGGTWDQRPGA